MMGYATHGACAQVIAERSLTTILSKDLKLPGKILQCDCSTRC
jgi:hypothetical protein